MKLIRGLHNLSSFQGPSVVTIGAFDGLHLGHQAVLSQLDEPGCQRVVMTFEPQPKEFFTNTPLERISRLTDKIQFLEKQGVDALLCIRFDEAFSKLSAQDFIDQVLVQGLQTKKLIIGDDFRFGHQRMGDFEMLSAQKAFETMPTTTFLLDGQRVSSSKVRQALLSGDFTRAEQLLGRPYRISGKVAHGDKNGREWGFPTLNIRLHHLMAVSGVFAVKVHGLGSTPVYGVANVGVRPTVTQGLTRLLEVHLFDFDREVYGERIEVEFVAKIRDEQRFESLEALKAQIRVDVESARRSLRAVRSG